MSLRFVPLSMTRRDIVIINIVVLLSFASTPLISFVSSLFLPRSSRSPPLLLPFINPSSFLPLFPVASLFSSASSVDHTCSFVYRLILASFIVISLFFFSSCLPCLSGHHFFPFFYRPVSLPWFSLLSTSCVSPSRRSLFVFSLLPPSCSNLFGFFLFSIFLSLLSVFLFSFIFFYFTRTGS